MRILCFTCVCPLSSPEIAVCEGLGQETIKSTHEEVQTLLLVSNAYANVI